MVDESKADYLVDHSAIMYLISPLGKFLEFYGPNMTPQQVAARVALQMTRFASRQNETDALRDRVKQTFTQWILGKVDTKPPV